MTCYCLFWKIRKYSADTKIQDIYWDTRYLLRCYRLYILLYKKTVHSNNQNLTASVSIGTIAPFSHLLLFWGKTPEGYFLPFSRIYVHSFKKDFQCQVFCFWEELRNFSEKISCCPSTAFLFQWSHMHQALEIILQRPIAPSTAEQAEQMVQLNQ